MYQDPFVLNKEEYIRDIAPAKHYVSDASFFLAKMRGITTDDASIFIRNNLDKRNPNALFPFHDPNIVSIEQLPNGDRELRYDDTLYGYISKAIKQDQIIAPPLTVFKPEKEQKAYLVDYIDYNVKERGVAKKAMFRYEMANDKNNYIISKNKQANKKIKNNSISGASCIATTPIYHSTMHPCLTSTCRITAGYANANNEKMLAGNRHYYTPEITINNIISICNNTDYDQLQRVMDKYNMHYPTVDETMEVIEYSTNLYYRNLAKHKVIRELLTKLSPLERAAFVYTGDLYHLRKFNDSLIRNLISTLAKKHEINSTIDNHMEIINTGPEAIYYLASQYCKKETIGVDVNKKENKEGDLGKLLASNMLEIYKAIEDYKDFYICFFRTINKPANISGFKDSMRRVVIMSDTDSTIFTVEEWIEWYFGEITFSDEANSVFAALVFLAVSSLKHILAMMSINLGVDRDKIHLIAMKNEFKFEVFVPTTNTKHYYALITYQEGNIYKTPKMEIKGVHLKSSNAPAFINKEAHAMMEEICTTVVKGNKISLVDYLKRTAEIERLIEKTIKEGKIDFYRLATIKEAAAYANKEEEGIYKAHLFWNDTFGKKYGTMAPPPYMVYKVNSAINNKTDMKNYLSTLDSTLANDISSFLKKNNKDLLTTFYVPIDLFANKPIPEEIIRIIDIRKMIVDISHTLYHILETLGVYRLNSNNTRLISDEF